MLPALRDMTEDSQIMTLDQMKIGEKGRITAIAQSASVEDSVPLAREELERRLLEAGFLEGETVEVMHHGPVGRDPIAVMVNDTLIALRRSEAEAVEIELDKGRGQN